MNTLYADGHYWTHSTFGPSVQAAWRKVEIKDSFVRVIEPVSEHRFSQLSFFAVNTMVGNVEATA